MHTNKFPEVELELFICRNIHPKNFIGFRDSVAWKIVNFEKWSVKSAQVPVIFESSASAPEVLAAVVNDFNTIIAKPSMDIWGLGLIFWEVLTGQPLFDDQLSELEVSTKCSAFPLHNVLQTKRYSYLCRDES